MSANEIIVQEPDSDESIVEEATRAIQDGNEASKTFSDAKEANASAQWWLGLFRKVVPPDLINRVGILVDGNRVVLFDAILWARGENDMETTSADPTFHVDPRLLPPQH